jgi:nucleoside-diphosphate-sugar epimerase
MIRKHFLITGGSGFIGRHLTKFLLEKYQDCQIHIIDIFPPEILHKRICFYQHDIKYKINFEIKYSNIICFHLAALAKEPGYRWEDYFYTNLRGTENLIDFAERNNINNIIFTSTMMVYRAGEKCMSEVSMTCPDTAYGISKLISEYSLKCWHNKSHDRRLRIVRAPVVFGEGENGNFTRLYIALKKKRFFYIGRSDTVKSCIYVKDIIRFLDFLIYDKTQNKVYNIAYQDCTTIKNICDAFIFVFKLKVKIITLPYSLALIFSYIFEFLNKKNIMKTDVHHRHVQKLYYSTNVSTNKISNTGFKIEYTLIEALEDWKNSCIPYEIGG